MVWCCYSLLLGCLVGLVVVVFGWVGCLLMVVRLFFLGLFIVWVSWLLSWLCGGVGGCCFG